MPSPTVDFQHFFFKYAGDSPFVLNDVSFELMDGETLFIGGSSGAGKSTLCNAIAGQIPHAITGQMKGIVRLLGKDTWDYDYREIAGLIGYVFQNADEQLVTFTVFDEIAFAAENLCFEPTGIRERVNQIAASLGITHLLERTVDKLSGGEKQKVIIAANLVTDPKILIFDEPFAFLDVDGQTNFISLLSRLKTVKPNLTVVIAEHRLSAFKTIVDKVLVLDDFGRVEYYGPVSTLDTSKGSMRKLRVETEYVCLADFVKRVSFTKEEKKNDQVLLDIDGIDFSYVENAKIFSDFSMKVKRGEFIGMVGSNGSGKTSLLLLIMGLLRPSRGSMQFDGIDYQQLEPGEIYPRVGFIFQNPEHQIFELTVRDEILYGPRNFNTEAEALAIEDTQGKIGDFIKMIHDERVSCEDVAKKNPFKLSWGQKRRLNISSVLSYEPDLLLVDEPFIGQDRSAVERILSMLDDAHARGKTVILVTHDLDLLQGRCTRIVNLDDPLPADAKQEDKQGGRVDRNLTKQAVKAKKNHRRKGSKRSKLDAFLKHAFDSGSEQGTSVGTHIHPIVKIVLLVIMTFFLFSERSLIMLGIASIIAIGISFKSSNDPRGIFNRVRWIFLLTLVYIPLNALFDATARPGDEVLFFLFPPFFPIRRLAMYFSMRAGIIIMSLFTTAIAFTRTTPIKDFVYGMIQAGVPYRHAFAVMIGIRYMPIIRDETNIIEIAQKFRGAGVRKGSSIRSIYDSIMRRISTLLVSVFKKSRITAMAIDIRGFGYNKRRTNTYKLPLQRRDYIVLLAAITGLCFYVLFASGILAGVRIPSLYSIFETFLM